jgi:hypothetical protein
MGLLRALELSRHGQTLPHVVTMDLTMTMALAQGLWPTCHERCK